MKSRSLLERAYSTILISVLVWGVEVGAQNRSDAKTYDLNVRDASLQMVLEALAQRADLQLDIEKGLASNISVGISDKSLEEALNILGRKGKFDWTVNDGVLRVSKRAGTISSTRTPAQESNAEPVANSDAASGGEGSIENASKSASPSSAASLRSAKSGNVRILRVNYIKASDLVEKIVELFGTDVKVVADVTSNSVILVPLIGSLDSVIDFIRAYDKMPKQILIEAQVIETSSHFAQEMGISWGNFGKAGPLPAKARFAVSPSMPKSSTVSAGFTFGSIDKQILEARLSAAESNGDAKIISRPKVVTADRLPAVISSGISYSVKTLAPASVGVTAAPAGGGLTTVTAGLNLNVTPKLADGNLVNLEIDISSSEADPGHSVDGIPGVVKSSAKTALVVPQGVTATIGGLVKYTASSTKSGVPFLSGIPLIGWLFESSARSKVNTELLIFITPHVLDDPKKETNL